MPDQPLTDPTPVTTPAPDTVPLPGTPHPAPQPLTDPVPPDISDPLPAGGDPPIGDPAAGFTAKAAPTDPTS